MYIMLLINSSQPHIPQKSKLCVMGVISSGKTKHTTSGLIGQIYLD